MCIRWLHVAFAVFVGPSLISRLTASLEPPPPVALEERWGNFDPTKEQTCFQLSVYNNMVTILHRPPQEQIHKMISGITVVCVCQCEKLCVSVLSAQLQVDSAALGPIQSSLVENGMCLLCSSCFLWAWTTVVNSYDVVVLHILVFLFWWLSGHQGSHQKLRCSFNVVWLRSGWYDGLIWSPIKCQALLKLNESNSDF